MAEGPNSILWPTNGGIRYRRSDSRPRSLQLLHSAVPIPGRCGNGSGIEPFCRGAPLLTRSFSPPDHIGDLSDMAREEVSMQAESRSRRALMGFGFLCGRVHRISTSDCRFGCEDHMKRRFAVLAIVGAVAFGLLAYLYGGHSVPAGQKPLTELSASALQTFRGRIQPIGTPATHDRHAFADLTDLHAGSLCISKLLAQHREIANLHVFVVWEPVLPTDLAAPSTTTMDRLPDMRVSQFWDPKRLLSRNMGEHDCNSVIWDYVAIYMSGETWAEAPPKPLYEGSPVVRSIAGADRALRRLSQ